ncbi:MAG: tetratricopeptide repeat protein, partial [Verrucomicrobiia bacterium]
SEALFSHALMVTKDNATAHSDLGQAFAREGRQNEALAEYREALRIEPNSADTRNNLATLLDEMGKPDEALAEYRRSLRLDPFNVPANINLGMVLVQLGRLDEAIQQYTQTARLDPENPDLQFQMGRALLLQGHDAAAISCFRRALRLSSNDFEILIYVARVLASDENETIRQGTIALALAAKANHLTQETQPLAFDTIAMAYAEIGRFPEAGQAEETAIKFATAYGQNGDVPAMKQRLELYKNGRPCRQTFTQTRTTVPPDKPPKN